MVYVYFDKLSSRVAMEKLENSLKELNIKYKLEHSPPRETEVGSYKYVFIDFGGIHDSYGKKESSHTMFLHYLGRFMRMIEDNPGTTFAIMSEVVWTYMVREVKEIERQPNVIRCPWIVTAGDVAKIFDMEY